MVPPSRPRRLIGVSLKMYLDIPQTQKYIEGIKTLATHAAAQNVDLVILPDFVNIISASQILQGTNVMLGAQDCFWEDSGAYTAEVSPTVLRQAGCRFVLLGDAERRRLFSETDEQVGRKAKAAARNGLTPLVCIGEKARSAIASEAVGLALRECISQVMTVLAAMPQDQEVILAYAPVWASEKGDVVSVDHVVAVTQQLRNLTMTRKGSTRILYGGSVGPGMFEELKECVDGFLLGRFGHDVENLSDLVVALGQP